MNQNQNEPQPRDENWPHYTIRSFPSYRFIPGKNPHPRRNPRGHSYGIPETTPFKVESHLWHTSEDYLYGIDLFNFAYWWECHEILESLWNVFEHNTPEGRFFQGVIYLAASQLKRFMDSRLRGETLAKKAYDRFQHFEGIYWGVRVDQLQTAIQEYLAQEELVPVLIRLENVFHVGVCSANPQHT